MQNVTFKASGAQTASTTGSAVTVNGPYTEALFILDVTALATDAADYLDVFVDVSPDGGQTWLNAIHFTQQAGNGSAAKLAAKLTKEGLADPDADLAVTADAASGVVRNLFVGNTYRYRSTVTDASTDDASFTYSLIGVFA